MTTKKFTLFSFVKQYIQENPELNIQYKEAIKDKEIKSKYMEYKEANKVEKVKPVKNRVDKEKRFRCSRGYIADMYQDFREYLAEEEDDLELLHLPIPDIYCKYEQEFKQKTIPRKETEKERDNRHEIMSLYSRDSNTYKYLQRLDVAN